jgi:hypothetical protein
LILFADDKEIQINDVRPYLTVKYNEHPEGIRSFIPTILASDKNIPMCKINLVVTGALNAGGRIIAYAVNDSTRVSKELNKIFHIYYPTGPIFDLVNDSIQQNALYILGQDTWKLNGVELSSDQLTIEFSKRLSQPNQAYTLVYDSTLILDDYLHTYDLYFEALSAKRNKLSRSMFHNDYDALNIENKKALKAICKWSLYDYRFCLKE